MKTSSLLACMLATSGLAYLPQVSAQTTPPALHPADPTAVVPVPVYQSPYAAPATEAEAEAAPIDWKKANADVGQFTRGHMDLLKWEASHPVSGDMLQTPGHTMPAMPGMAH